MLYTIWGGRSAVVFEEGEAEHGCSAKNGEQISNSVNPSLEKLMAKFCN